MAPIELTELLWCFWCMVSIVGEGQQAEKPHLGRFARILQLPRESYQPGPGRRCSGPELRSLCCAASSRRPQASARPARAWRHRKQAQAQRRLRCLELHLGPDLYVVSKTESIVSMGEVRAYGEASDALHHQPRRAFPSSRWGSVHGTREAIA